MLNFRSESRTRDGEIVGTAHLFKAETSLIGFGNLPSPDEQRCESSRNIIAEGREVSPIPGRRHLRIPTRLHEKLGAVYRFVNVHVAIVLPVRTDRSRSRGLVPNKVQNEFGLMDSYSEEEFHVDLYRRDPPYRPPIQLERNTIQNMPL